ncbi:hypothetical protein [Actinopolyspora mortivallis]|uniref:hypothetical protein n=1 Tax=Actinopolyspora mortivallis TaxID=33906 RepID=UPI00036B96A4|nr:hypothetical protein [Actinopolyspora mortivallis]
MNRTPANTSHRGLFRRAVRVAILFEAAALPITLGGAGLVWGLTRSNAAIGLGAATIGVGLSITLSVCVGAALRTWYHTTHASARQFWAGVSLAGAAGLLAGWLPGAGHLPMALFAAVSLVVLVRAPVALLVSAGVAAVPDEPTPPWCPLS